MAAAFRPVWGYTPAAPEGADTFDLSVRPPVRPTIALLRTPQFPQRSGHLFLLLPYWLCSIHRQTPEHLFGTLCRTARRNESWAIPSLCRATPSATSEHLMGLLGSSPIPRQDRWDCSLISHRRRPSLDSRRVGSCITRFGACTAFTIVTAYKLAKSPTRPSTPEASAASLPLLLLRLLPGGANQFPGGIFPAVDQRLFTAHEKSGITLPSVPSAVRSHCTR